MENQGCSAFTSPLQTTNRHAATAGGGGKNGQAPTPSLSFIPSQKKRLTLIAAHFAEGKRLPATCNISPPLKSKPAGRVPPDAFLFVQAATKRKPKNAFHLRWASLAPAVLLSIQFGGIDGGGGPWQRGRCPYLLLGPQGLNGEFISTAVFNSRQHASPRGPTNKLGPRPPR